VAGARVLRQLSLRRRQLRAVAQRSVAHAPLVGQNTAPISVDGDPIQFSDETRMSRVSSVSRWDTQGLSSSDANYLQYHPWQLCQADQTLVEGGPILTPAPEEFTGKFWRSTSGRAVSQSFEMDLRSTPLETSRRPFRYHSPRSTRPTPPARTWRAAGWPSVAGPWDSSTNARRVLGRQHHPQHDQ